MRKSFVVGLSILIALSFSACSNNSSSPSSSISSTKTSKKVVKQDSKKVSGPLTKVGSFLYATEKKQLWLKYIILLNP